MKLQKPSNFHSPQQSLLDSYIIQRTLGYGSTAKVKLVIDSSSQASYAAKIIKMLPSFSPHYYRSLLLSEVVSLRKIAHKNIIHMIDYKESGSYISKAKGFYRCMYIILEYCPYGELFELIKKNGSLTKEVSLFYFRQIIDALESCNTFGFNHGDLKPDNILIGENLEIRLIDFGLCNEIGSDHMEFVGTDLYLPPEARLNLKIDPVQADLFVAGVILFIMYVGCPPFRFAGQDDLLYSIISSKHTEKF